MFGDNMTRTLADVVRQRRKPIPDGPQGEYFAAKRAHVPPSSALDSSVQGRSLLFTYIAAQRYECAAYLLEVDVEAVSRTLALIVMLGDIAHRLV